MTTKKIFRKIDEDIAEVGLQAALKKVVDGCGGVDVVGLSGETKKVLENDPVLLISNHPSQAEVLVIMSCLPKRDDVNLVASHNFLNVIDNFDKHIIPVYIDHRMSKAKKTEEWKMNIFKIFHHPEFFHQEESHRKNIESISLAAKKIHDGELVVIFPISAENNGCFFPGVGHITKDVVNPAAKLIMAYVSGTSSKDYLRPLKIFNKFLPKIKVWLSTPISLNTFKSETPKATAKEMEEKYYEWVKTIK